jgi:hypothetical protein
MLSRVGLIALLAALALVACSGGAPATPSPAPTAVPTATAAPTAAPTPTARPSPAPTASPTVASTAVASATPQGAFPSAAEDLLISFAAPDMQATCGRYPPTYDTELASISCGPEDLIFQYTLFGSLSDMAAGYNNDLSLGDSPPAPGGSCPEGNFEGPYNSSAGDYVGRFNCRQHTSSSSGSLYHVIEWTNDGLLVIGYISNRADLRSWADLIAFWQDAGPHVP